MDLKDMILVMENYKGTERNMLMTLEDYKKFVAIDDMSELADQMLLLGRTLAEGFTEYYRAANVTVFAKFCRDDVELGRFLQGYYNDSKKFYFDKATSSPECITKMDEIGMTDRGWIDDFILHYEKCDRTFERAKLKQKFYFYQDLSKDDDIPKNMQNDFLHQMYKEFGTIEEEYFYDRLEDGKYDEGFKERQVKEKKSR